MELDHRLVRAHGFAIMDPCVVAPAYWPKRPHRSLAPGPLASRAHLLPSLVDLRGLSPDALAETADAATRWETAHGTAYFSALMASPEGAESLADTLRARFIARPPASTAKCLLRWHDPRVFEHLLRIFRPARINHLLHSLTHWTWRSRQGGWVTTRAFDDVVPSPAMDDATWRRLERLAVVNRILEESKALLVVHPDPIGTVWPLVDRAHEVHGLVADADCRLFVKQALQHGEGIHSHPALAACLAQARAGTATYVGACARLHPEALRAWTPTQTPPRMENHGV